MIIRGRYNREGLDRHAHYRVGGAVACDYTRPLYREGLDRHVHYRVGGAVACDYTGPL